MYLSYPKLKDMAMMQSVTASMTLVSLNIWHPPELCSNIPGRGIVCLFYLVLNFMLKLKLRVLVIYLYTPIPVFSMTQVKENRGQSKGTNLFPIGN